MVQFIDTNNFGRVQTLDGSLGLEIRPVEGVNDRTGKPYRQHNIVLLNGNPDEAELVGAFNTLEDAEQAYDRAAKCVTLADALIVLDEMSLHLYQLHFSEPISTANMAQHYSGCTENMEERIKVHLKRSNAAIVKAAVDRGLEVTVAWTRIGGWSEERYFKHVTKNGRRACPICNGGG